MDNIDKEILEKFNKADSLRMSKSYSKAVVLFNEILEKYPSFPPALNNKEIFNIGPDEDSISINGLYKMLCNKLQFNEPAVYYADRPNEVRHAICSSDKARKLLGYKTSVNLNDSINGVIEFIKSKGPKNFEYNYELEINNELTPETWKKKLF